MANSHFYGICRWVDDNGTMKKSVEIEVTLASGVTYSDHATAAVPTPKTGDPVVWSVTFPKSDDYASMLAGCAPQLPPASSDLFCFCTRTKGGQTQVCDFDIAVNKSWLNDLAAYLVYWFPDLHTKFVALNLPADSKRAAVVDALSQIIQPGIAAIPRS